MPAVAVDLSANKNTPANDANPVRAAFTALQNGVNGLYGQGLLAARPAAGNLGNTFFATDTGVLFRDNGTGWDTVLTGVGHAALLGLSTDGVVRRGKSIIAATETRTNVAYGLMPTADRVSGIVLPTDGLICVAYQATWQETNTFAATASIFIGANSVKKADPAGVSDAATNLGGTVNTDRPLVSGPQGLRTDQGSAAAYTGDVTTGQAVGATVGSEQIGGPTYIFAAAGTYDVSIQFKASSGSVTVKNRKLWVWTMGF